MAFLKQLLCFSQTPVELHDSVSSSGSSLRPPVSADCVAPPFASKADFWEFAYTSVDEQNTHGNNEPSLKRAISPSGFDGWYIGDAGNACSSSEVGNSISALLARELQCLVSGEDIC